MFPIALFVLCSIEGRLSKIALFSYAVASGLIDSVAVRKLAILPPGFGGTLLGYVPIVSAHLAGVGVIAWICRLLTASFGWPPEHEPTRRQQFARVIVFVGIIVIAFFSPCIYQQAVIRRLEKEGRDRADADWAAHTAAVWGWLGWAKPRRFANVTITSQFDFDTGLPVRGLTRDGIEDAYWRRLVELIRIHGVPSWSQKSRLASDLDLVAMLNNSTMVPVPDLPYDVAPGIVLFRNGDITRWGVTMTSFSHEMTIGSRYSGASVYEDLSEADVTYVGRSEKYPGVIFVRYGHEWIAECTEDGWILEYATTKKDRLWRNE
jgi:hypothetical protein